MYSLRVFLSVHGRLKDVLVRVGDIGQGNPKDSKCGFYPGVVPQAGNVTIQCSPPAVGRFVSLTPSVPVEFTLCEVEVAATAASCQGDIHLSIYILTVFLPTYLQSHTYIHSYIIIKY